MEFFNIFGIIAFGRTDGCSDIDVLIVGDASFNDISAALLQAQEQIEREMILGYTGLLPVTDPGSRQ